MILEDDTIPANGRMFLETISRYVNTVIKHSSDVDDLTINIDWINHVTAAWLYEQRGETCDT